MITIDDDKISWKLEKNEAIKRLNLDSIKRIEPYVGEVHIETLDGNLYKLSSHKNEAVQV